MRTKSFLLLALLAISAGAHNASGGLVCVSVPLPGVGTTTIAQSFTDPAFPGGMLTLNGSITISDFNSDGIFNFADVFSITTSPVTFTSPITSAVVQSVSLDISGWDPAADTLAAASDPIAGNGANTYANGNVFLQPDAGGFTIGPTLTFKVQVVPEASTYMMFGLFGLIGLAGSRLGRWRC